MEKLAEGQDFNIAFNYRSGSNTDPEYRKLNRYESVRKTETKRFRVRHAIKGLNLLILLALATFVVLRISNIFLTTLKLMRDKEVRNEVKNGNFQSKTSNLNATKPVPIKVPWRFQIEDDGFVFPTRRKKELFVSYRPIAVRWTKQLLQFENAVVFAYLLKRTLVVPPLLPPRDATPLHEGVNRSIHSVNDTTNQTHPYIAERSQKHDYQLPVSKIIDFRTLSKVVSLKEVSLEFLRNLPDDSVYYICHDHRLGFWVDFMPSIENIQIWRLLRAQQFNAFPVSLDDHESDLMCPGTLQYGNRWGPPMNVKPILRSILTELYPKEDDMIFFEGDTLSTRDIRFFNKERTKKLQEIMIFNLQFTKRVNKILKNQFKHIQSPYNAILAGSLSDNGTEVTDLEERLRQEKFIDTSRTIFVSCREEDRHKFEFLINLGFDVKFGLQMKERKANKAKARQDIRKLCELIVCAYASKFTYISTSPDAYYVEHLRLQNVTMRDGLVTDKINVRWAQHTKLPSRDERVLLHKKYSEKLPNDKPMHGEVAINNTSAANATVLNGEGMGANSSEIHRKNSTLKASHAVKVQPNVSGKRLKKKFRSKLDIMVCTFCHYIRRVTGEHGCPTLKSWCP